MCQKSYNNYAKDRFEFLVWQCHTFAMRSGLYLFFHFGLGWPLLLKGQCHEMDIFFEVLNILCADCFQLLTFYLLLWNYLLIFKMFTKTLLRIPFSVTGRCSLVPTSRWLHGKCARINLLQATSGIFLQDHRRLPVSIFSVKIAAVGSLKMVTGKISKN